MTLANQKPGNVRNSCPVVLSGSRTTILFLALVKATDVVMSVIIKVFILLMLLFFHSLAAEASEPVHQEITNANEQQHVADVLSQEFHFLKFLIYTFRRFSFANMH